MKPKVKAWILFPGGTKFGEGRAELLRRVDEEGSLKRAVEEMEMSYRAAWGYLRELEAAAGFPFLERAPGGPRAGTRLTKRARAFLRAYEDYRSGVEGASAGAFRTAFPGGPRQPATVRRRSGGTRP